MHEATPSPRRALKADAWECPRGIYEREGLNPAPLRCALYLWNVEAGRRPGNVTTTKAAIAAACGRDVRSVADWLKELDELGLIELLDRQAIRRQRSVTLYMFDPDEVSGLKRFTPRDRSQRVLFQTEEPAGEASPAAGTEACVPFRASDDGDHSCVASGGFCAKTPGETAQKSPSRFAGKCNEHERKAELQSQLATLEALDRPPDGSGISAQKPPDANLNLSSGCTTYTKFKSQMRAAGDDAAAVVERADAQGRRNRQKHDELANELVERVEKTRERIIRQLQSAGRDVVRWPETPHIQWTLARKMAGAVLYDGLVWEDVVACIDNATNSEWVVSDCEVDRIVPYVIRGWQNQFKQRGMPWHPRRAK